MSRLSYFARRLMEMPPHAIARKAWLRWKPYFYAPSYTFRRRNAAAVPATEVARVFRVLEALSTDSEVLEHGPDYYFRIAHRASSVLASRFEVLGYGETDIPTGRGWHRDPFHGYEWPSEFFPRVDFAATNAHCDVKIPWELSRLQFLVWLAEAVRLGGADTAACVARFESILEDWIDSNPPGFGVNWTCGMEVAIRSVNLVFAAAGVADRLSPACRQALVQSLIDHRTFLRRFPEYSEVTGNHYLANLMGIAVLNCALDGPDSTDFRRSLAVFGSEADRQFEPSGVHLEYATVYHRLCMDMVIIVHALATQAGERAAKPLVRVLERGMTFADSVATPGGLLPIFGDSDSGHVLWFGADARRLDAMRAYCHGCVGADGHDHLARFLSHFRCDTGALFAARSAQSGITGPFVAMRNQGITLIARHGAQGLKGRAPHDHDDALSFWAFLGDEDLFMDIGCLSYTLDPRERRAAIVSSGHAVWSPAGCERFAPVDGSVFVSIRGAAHALVDFCSKDDTLVCELDMRGPLGRSLAEQRRFILSDILQVDDTLRLRESATMQMSLRLGPEFTAEENESRDGVVILRAGQPKCHFKIRGNGHLDIGIAEDMWAPQYGRRETIFAIRLRSGCSEAHRLTWTLSLDRGGTVSGRARPSSEVPAT